MHKHTADPRKFLLCTLAALTHCGFVVVPTGPDDASTRPVSNDASREATTGPTPDAPPPPDATAPSDARALPDAASFPDAPLANAGDAPHMLGPLSTSTVTSRRPALRWTLASGSPGAELELCLDRDCTQLIERSLVLGISTQPSIDLPVGVVYWRLRGLVPGGGVSTTYSPTWEFFVGARSAPVNSAWGNALDVNGDGYADVLVGANQPAQSGHAYLYLGSVQGLSATPATTLAAPDGYLGNFGQSVASAGDVNGDGYADALVGGRDTASGVGRVHLYLGGPGGLAATPSRSLTAPLQGDRTFGESLAGVGDANGDGYADVLVGAYDPTGPGHAYLYLGGPDGPALAPAATLEGPDGAGSAFGSTVVSAGDVDGDGYGDVAIAAPQATAQRTGYPGRVYVYRGGAAGLSAPHALQGGEEYGAFGGSLVCAGDVDGDGYADLAVGSPWHDVQGHVRVFHGYAGGLRDAPSAVLAGRWDFYGQYAQQLAGPGDVDGDGYADLAVGEYGQGSNLGRVHLYRGSSAGLSNEVALSLTGPDGPGDGFGWSLAGAGDVNGDGLGDLAVGAPGVSGNTGRTHVYYGAPSGFGPRPSRSLDGVDGAQGYFGQSVASVRRRRAWVL